MMVCKCEVCGDIFETGTYKDFSTSCYYPRIRVLVEVVFQSDLDGEGAAEIAEFDGLCPACLNKLASALRIPVTKTIDTDTPLPKGVYAPIQPSIFAKGDN